MTSETGQIKEWIWIQFEPIYISCVAAFCRHLHGDDLLPVKLKSGLGKDMLHFQFKISVIGRVHVLEIDYVVISVGGQVSIQLYGTKTVYFRIKNPKMSNLISV